MEPMLTLGSPELSSKTLNVSVSSRRESPMMVMFTQDSAVPAVKMLIVDNSVKSRFSGGNVKKRGSIIFKAINSEDIPLAVPEIVVIITLTTLSAGWFKSAQMVKT